MIIKKRLMILLKDDQFYGQCLSGYLNLFTYKKKKLSHHFTLDRCNHSGRWSYDLIQRVLKQVRVREITPPFWLDSGVTYNCPAEWMSSG